MFQGSSILFLKLFQQEKEEREGFRGDFLSSLYPTIKNFFSRAWWQRVDRGTADSPAGAAGNEQSRSEFWKTAKSRQRQRLFLWWEPRGEPPGRGSCSPGHRRQSGIPGPQPLLWNSPPTSSSRESLGGTSWNQVFLGNNKGCCWVKGESTKQSQQRRHL